MIVFPRSVSFPRRTSFLALAALICAVLFTPRLAAAPLAVSAEPGTQAAFKAASAEGAPVVLGVVPADGLLLLAEAPASAGTLIFTHPEAVGEVALAFDPVKSPGKISPNIKLRPATLIVAALPADETEIFINGQHRGRGAVTLGGVAPREKITVEARSARRGMQSRVVSAEPGESLTVKFDLRGNEISSRPDGQIVLPELPLVLASQPGGNDPSAASMRFMSLWLMPIMMFFICNQLSAALSYYYLLSQLISILETVIIRKSIDKEAILEKVRASEGKPLPKSKWQQRIEEAQRIQEQQLREQRRKQGRK